VTTPTSGRASPAGVAGAPSAKTGTVIVSSRPAPVSSRSKRGARLAATSAALDGAGGAGPPGAAAEWATGRPCASETTTLT
jgi:hypothetical protein